MDTKMSSILSDALKEMMTIGTGHAVDAIAQMVQRKVMIHVPQVDLVPINIIPDRIGKKRWNEEVIVGLYFKMLGDLSGDILLVFSKESADKISGMLFEDFVLPDMMKNIQEQENMRQSALMEVGNILVNSYLNALASITDMKLFPSVPHYAEDVLGAVFDYLLIHISMTSNTALYMETEFVVEGASLSGDLLIFPDFASMEKILEKLGLKS